MIELNSRAEYQLAVDNGHEPLLNWRMFTLPIKLRIELQYELFGSTDFQKQNEKFYRWMWDNSIHCCSETGKPLENYSAVYVSHIISRGSDRRLSIDPRNVNILSFEAHQLWESENNFKMNIYRENKLIIRMLKKDYNITL